MTPAALAYPLRWARDRSIPTLVPPELVAVRSARMPGSPTGAASLWALSTVPRSHVPTLRVAGSLTLFCSHHYYRNRIQ